MKRRRFIGIIGIGTVAIASGSYISFSDFDNAIKKIITDEIGVFKLKVDETEIFAFIKDANKAGLWSTYSVLKKELIKLCTAFENMGLPLHLIARYKWYRNEIVQQFLFSTSFFYDGMDEKKPVRYLRIYDPYTTPCCNPFSNLYYP